MPLGIVDVDVDDLLPDYYVGRLRVRGMLTHDHVTLLHATNLYQQLQMIIDETFSPHLHYLLVSHHTDAIDLVQWTV